MASVNLAEESGINYNETNLVTYQVLRKQLLDDGPIYLNESNSRYIDIFYEQTTTNWYLPYKERYKSTRIEAR